MLAFIVGGLALGVALGVFLILARPTGPKF